MRYGIRSVSLDDIARQLGISKKTIYQFYADKDELVQAVSQAHLDDWNVRMETSSHRASDAIEEMLGYTQILREQFSQMNPAIMFDLYKFHRKAWDHFSSFKNEVIRERLRATLMRGIRDGHFRDNIQVDILATLRVEEVEMGFDNEVFPHATFSLEQVQMQLFDHFIHGLLTDKGRIRYEDVRNQLLQLSKSGS